MFFNSFEFLGFFLVVLCVIISVTHFTKSVGLRNVLLLIASYYFYGSFSISFLAILLYVTAINYVGGFCLCHTRYRKAVVGTVVTLTLLPLLTFKYSAFLIHDVLGVSDAISGGVLARWILPVGISFFTFQALTYTIDLYREKVKRCDNVVDFALFVSFFPTVLSGPIEKARNLLPQLKALTPIRGNDLAVGCSYFVWGIFKKMAIADRLSAYVDWAYSSADYVSGGTLALAAIFYSIQIYCDFSGYSDMAIGVARCLGFKLSQNFLFPYFSTRIKDFWRKWHISLTTWFTEYVYFSLGGNRVKLKTRWMFNISMVFLLSGIWHGAAWNFLLWGAIHAFLYLFEHFAGFHRKDFAYRYVIQKVFAGIIVFILVTIAWMFFRIEDVTVVWEMLVKIFTSNPLLASPGASSFTFALNLLMITFMGGCEAILYRHRCEGDAVLSRNMIVQGAWVLLLLLMIALFGRTSDNFVYFQF